MFKKMKKNNILTFGLDGLQNVKMFKIQKNNILTFGLDGLQNVKMFKNAKYGGSTVLVCYLRYLYGTCTLSTSSDIRQIYIF